MEPVYKACAPLSTSAQFLMFYLGIKRYSSHFHINFGINSQVAIQLLRDWVFLPQDNS